MTKFVLIELFKLKIKIIFRSNKLKNIIIIIIKNKLRKKKKFFIYFLEINREYNIFDLV
jgi:hypothetical protein